MNIRMMLTIIIIFIIIIIIIEVYVYQVCLLHLKSFITHIGQMLCAIIIEKQIIILLFNKSSHIIPLVIFD